MATPSEIAASEDAAWAKTFRASPTNLAQRSRRIAQDDAIEKDAYNQDRQKEVQQEQFLQTNKGARDLMFGRQNAELAASRQRLAEERLRHDKDKQAFNETMKLRSDEIAMANERRKMQKDLQDTENAKRILDHTTALENDVQVLLGGGQVEGTTGFAKGVIASILRNPMADKQTKADLFKAARISGDPDIIIPQAAELGLVPSGARLDPQSGELVPTFSRPTVKSGGSSSPSEKPHPNLRMIESLKNQITNLDPKGDQAKIEAKKARIAELQNAIPTRSNEPSVGAGDVRSAEGTDLSTSPTVSTREQFDALPPGAEYVGKDGRRYRKP